MNRLTVLGSGSGGNSVYLETDSERILIDCGLSAKVIRQRLAQIGRTPETLTAILLTHEHTDHIDGLGTLCAKLPIPIHCNQLTADQVAKQSKTKFDFRVFKTGSVVQLNNLEFQSFPVPHDAADPVGYVLCSEGKRIGLLTDCGHLTPVILEHLKFSNVLILETNYDSRLLDTDLSRPESVRQRIAGPLGHLSNAAAAEILQQIITSDLTDLILYHLSTKSNTPGLALQTIDDCLTQLGAYDVRIHSTDQLLGPTLTF